MRTATTAFALLSLALTAGSAIAGPDWAIIERARAAKQQDKAGLSGVAESAKRPVYSQGPRAPYTPPVAFTTEAAEPVATKAVIAANSR
jgi:hypothetical protein